MNDQACCPWLKRGSMFLGMALAAGLAGAGYWAGRQSAPTVEFPFSALGINATATDSGEEFAIATGTVSDEAEGLFVLDYATGILQCHVLYPRAGQFGASFSVNIKQALPGDVAKGASKYLMVTGRVEFPGSAQRSGNSCVYVLDTTTGAFVAYGVPFDRTAVSANRPQTNSLVPIATGTARGIVDRDRQR